MARRSPQGSDVATVVLELEDPFCGVCGPQMHVRSRRRRRIYGLGGPLLLECKLMQCPRAACPNHRGTFSPEQELTLALPRWLIGWDMFCWLGHRRFARHWSVPQIRAELKESYAIELSEDAIEDYLQRYQCMLAARQQDFALLQEAFATTREVVLSIDGLQPEKGHEALYVVRELGRERVWFAQPLLSSAIEVGAVGLGGDGLGVFDEAVAVLRGEDFDEVAAAHPEDIIDKALQFPR